MQGGKGFRCTGYFGFVLGLALLGSLFVMAPVETYASDGARKVKTKVSPAYPELAKRMAITGTVKVELVVDPSGTVTSAKALGGHPILIQSAVDAAKRWRYEPSDHETTDVVEFRFSPSGS